MAGPETHEVTTKSATDLMADAFEGVEETSEGKEALGKKAQAEAQDIHDNVMTMSSNLEEALAKANEACKQIADHLNSKTEYKGKDFNIRIESGWTPKNKFNLFGRYNSESQKWEMTNYRDAPFPPS